MISLLLSAALAFTPSDAHFAYQVASNLISECPVRDAGTIRGRMAANWILDAASAVGADVKRDVFRAGSPNGVSEYVNLYARFRGNPTNKWVVLVSHFDTKPGTRCPGANDGAVTSALLVSFANILASSRPGPYPGNVILIWTDAEECVNAYGPHDGLQGSVRAAEWLETSGLPVQAVICLDMLGDRDLHVSIPANRSEKLAKIACHAARRVGCPDLVTFMDEYVKDDHVAFLDRGFNAIDLIDFSYGPDNSWWHTPEDTMDKVSEESLLKAGRVVAELLRILL